MMQNNVKGAMPLFEEVLEMEREVLHEEHPDLGHTLTSLAQVCVHVLWVYACV
jgi:hypothetical protein